MSNISNISIVFEHGDRFPPYSIRSPRSPRSPFR